MPTKMEATFYEDSASSSQQQQQHGGGGMGGGTYGFNPKTMKQSMTLNLNDPKNFKPQLRAKAIDILTSPDVGLLKLASPELERLIIQSCTGLTTPTPTQFLCPRNITDEQEGFAEGFVRALAELHYQQHPNTSSEQPTRPGGNTDMAPLPTVSESYSCTVRPAPPEYTNLGTFGNRASAPPTGDRHSSPSYTAVPSQNQPDTHHHHQLSTQQHPRLQAFKEEPQTVPEMSGDTPPMSPIDMESQERIKAERKRMRNRVAASKCRKRKLERISRLEDRVKNLKTTHTELLSSANGLRDELALLKQKVMDHVNSGCQLILTQQLQAF